MHVLRYPAMIQIKKFHDPTDNLRFTFQPAVITFPKNAQDVSTIIQIAQKFSYSAVARSGGVCLWLSNASDISDGPSSIATLLILFAERTALW